MTKEITVVPQHVSTLPSREEMEKIQMIAKFAAESKHFEKLGGVGGIFCVAMYAHEIGEDIMASLYGGMQNIMGKITIAPEMLMGMIRKKGHKLEIIETTDKSCKIKGTRKDSGETYTSIYTIEEAEKAGLVKPGGGWTKNPSDMLFARCSGRLKRRLFQDIATKAYVEGELEEADVEIIQSKPTIEINQQQENENIPAEIAARIERDIDTLITPVDGEYKKNLLSFFKAEGFDKIPTTKLKAIEQSVAKKVASLKKAEIETAEVVK